MKRYPCGLLGLAGFGLISAAAQAQPASGTRAAPVTVATAIRADVPIFASGLGTVQAWQSVTARAQVNGYLTQINFAEGQEVHRGDLLALIDPRPYAALLEQAQARKQADAALLANDQVNAQRDQRLARESYATRQQADNDAAAVRQAEANVTGDAASVMQAQLNLDFCRITAPIDGVVGFRLVDVGNLIQSGSQTAIVTIQQIHPIALVFTLAEQDLPLLETARLEQKPAGGRLAVVATTSDEKTELGRGELVAQNNSIDSTTGTISLKAEFLNPSGGLWPGQYVNAHLQLRVQHDAVTVPPAAVQHGPDGLFVYVVRPDHTVANQPVTVSYQDPARAVIGSGLNGGEQVVTDGQSRLQDGARVAASQTKS